MSTLLTLFKASKQLYQHFEDSRFLTNIPYARSQKAFKLNDNQVPDPKEDGAIEEFIQKLAADADIEKTTHLKNLIKILQHCISKTDTATLRSNLAVLREENKNYFNTQISYSDYQQALNDFINHKIELEHQAAIATLQLEIKSRSDINSQLNAERERLLAENTSLQQTLSEQAQDLVNIDHRNISLAEKKIHNEGTIAALRQEIEMLKESIDKLEATQSELETESNTLKYHLSETTKKLDRTGVAYLETDSKLAESEQTINKLEKQIITLKAQQKEKITALQTNIEVQLDTINRLHTSQTNASRLFESQRAEATKQHQDSIQQLEISLDQANDIITKLGVQLSDASSKFEKQIITSKEQ
jgi:chromosome segregation ATPase